MSESEAPRDAGVAAFEERLGYHFADPELLDVALRHASRAHEAGAVSNERLEFLGDAVLGLAVAHVLFTVHPDWAEGDLTRAQASVVSGKSLARVARRIDLGSVLELGRSELQSGGAAKDTILEDAMEAVIGAMYLDGGLDGVERFVRFAFPKVVSPGASPVERDPKTVLNELAMERTGEFPSYELIQDTGEEHGEARFSMRVLLKGRVCGEGSGRSKRAAQVAAARVALEQGIEADD